MKTFRGFTDEKRESCCCCCCCCCCSRPQEQERDGQDNQLTTTFKRERGGRNAVHKISLSASCVRFFLLSARALSCASERKLTKQKREMSSMRRCAKKNRREKRSQLELPLPLLQSGPLFSDQNISGNFDPTTFVSPPVRLRC